MSEYLKLKGLEAELKQKRTSLVIGAQAHIKAMREALATALITPLQDIDVNGIEYHALQLKAKGGEIAGIDRQIAEIKKDLGEG